MKPMLLGRLCVAALAGFTLQTFFEGSARAEDTLACTKSYESAQILKKKHEYISARRDLITCMRECPAVVQRECGQWFDALEAVVPSIVIHAEAAGDDRTEVKVELDGKMLSEKLDGKAIDLDPGQHELKFSLPGFPDVRKSVLVREGEQLRLIHIVFEQPEATFGLAAKPAPPPPVMRRPVPVVVYVVGGIAVAGGAGFAGFGLVGSAQRSRLESRCSPRCQDSAVDGVHRNLLIADVSLGVGLAALATDAILFFTRPTVSVSSERAAFAVAPSPTGASFLATLPF
jgi:hypothetical protein